MIIRFHNFISIFMTFFICLILYTLSMFMLTIEITLSAQESLCFFYIDRCKLLSPKPYTLIQKPFQVIKPNRSIDFNIFIYYFGLQHLIPVHVFERTIVKQSETRGPNGLTVLIVLIKLLISQVFAKVSW